MSPGWAYAIATFGSLGVELTALVRDLAANDGRLPRRYKRVAYPTARVLFAFIAAGPLAILLSAETALSAFYIGATAPLIFDRLAAGIQPIGGGKDDPELP